MKNAIQIPVETSEKDMNRKAKAEEQDP